MIQYIREFALNIR